jgi:hypothetical protein
MRVVPSALVRPHHCAVFPQLGANHADGYFDRQRPERDRPPRLRDLSWP